MIGRPPGVQMRYDKGNGVSYLGAPPKSEYAKFLDKPSAVSFVAQLRSAFPSMTFTDPYEDGEEMARYVFASDTSPRIYRVDGNNAVGTAVFGEDIGELLYRMVDPEGEDEGGPYKSGDQLQMNLDYRYGYAFFFWSKVPAPPSNQMPLSFVTANGPVTTPPAPTGQLQSGTSSLGMK